MVRNFPQTPSGSLVKPIYFTKLILGAGSFTKKEAEAVFPSPPSVEVTVPVTLSFEPVVVPVTVTLNVQLSSAAMDPPVKTIVSATGSLSVTVSVPPH